MVTLTPETEQLARYEALQTALFDGTALERAVPLQLQIDAFALFGWASDYVGNGDQARHPNSWLQTAIRVFMAQNDKSDDIHKD